MGEVVYFKQADALNTTGSSDFYPTKEYLSTNAEKYKEILRNSILLILQEGHHRLEKVCFKH